MCKRRGAQSSSLPTRGPPPPARITHSLVVGLEQRVVDTCRVGSRERRKEGEVPEKADRQIGHGGRDRERGERERRGRRRGQGAGQGPEQRGTESEEERREVEGEGRRTGQRTFQGAQVLHASPQSPPLLLRRSAGGTLGSSSGALRSLPVSWGPEGLCLPSGLPALVLGSRRLPWREFRALKAAGGPGRAPPDLCPWRARARGGSLCTSDPAQ